MTNPFDWGYLTRVPTGYEAYGPFALTLVIVLVAGLVVSLLAGRIAARVFREHSLHRRLATRAGEIAGWIFGATLLFFGFRALELGFLGMRLWLYLGVLAGVAAVGWAIWYWRTRYPAQLARYQQEQERQRYLRGQRAARRPAADTPPAGRQPNRQRPRR